MAVTSGSHDEVCIFFPNCMLSVSEPTIKLLILPQLSACRQDQDDFDESADEDEYDDYDDDIEDEEIDKY